MKINTNGLVLREVKLRESDKILTVMTPTLGVISVSAGGSMRPTNKLFSASGLFCYAEWTLFEGKTMFRADEAAPIEVFFGLRNSIEAMSLAAYIADLLQILSPTGEEADRLLRLALNSLYLLAQQKKDPRLVKAVFELRSLSESGFMPDLLGCGDCGRYDGAGFAFSTKDGTLLCGDCARQRGVAPNLDAAALAALRHAVLADDEKVFAFTLKDDSARQLTAVAEEYALCHLDYPPKTLSFLKTVL